MAKVHLVIPDSHAHYRHNNDRAIWLGRLIADVKPDVVVDLGDTADMPSLSGYDKNTKSFQGRTYRQDIDSHNDFQEKLWNEVKKQKKKRPLRVRLIGNHEQRIDRALQMQPELEGAIGYEDLDLERYYDVIVPYVGSTPGTIEIDGVTYAHYLVSGIAGRPISGDHHAHSLLAKKYSSCTVGHSHLFDYAVRTRADGHKIMGCVAGVFQDFDSDWAGEMNKLWHRGVVVKTNVENGCYDLSHISINSLKKKYK